MPHLLFDNVSLVQDFKELDIQKLILKGRNQMITEEHIKIIMFNLLNSLQVIHSAGIVHRDIKPANVLIDSTCSINICDFGLSTVL